jgi:hypothetical protein
MSRHRITGFVAAIALGGAVVFGSGIASSHTADPAGGRAYITRADFDQAFTDAAAASRLGNTPTNREKLRNIGWKRLNVPIASK